MHWRNCFRRICASSKLVGSEGISGPIAQITNDEKEKSRLADIARNSASVLDTAADQVSAPKAALSSRYKEADDVGAPATGNDNMIDGQRVTRKGDFWVNSKGKVMSRAGD